MKKYFAIITLLLGVLAAPAHAQMIRFGVQGGLNVSQVHFNTDLWGSDNVTGFHFGPMLDFRLPLGIGADAAVLYTRRGVDGSHDGAIREIHTDYLDVPVNLKWRIGLPIVKPYLAAGPYLSFRVAGDKWWDAGHVSDQLKAKSFGAGLNFGAGAELFDHLLVGFRYSLGLTSNYSELKDDKMSDIGKDRGWVVTAGWLF